LPMV